ncbi:MAG: peptidoglycan-binding domain-containing protein [Gemmatimonadaceae bacterium]
MQYRLLGIASAALAFAATTGAAAQSRIVLPAGSVLIGRTTTALQSATAQAGQTFETIIDESVGVDEYTIIPAGSRIRGVVTVARPATRQQSGVIEVMFDRLTFSDGTSLPIRGRLTSTDSAERRQIKSDPNAHVVLVGGRGGIGAAIAGAGSSKSTNNILAALGGLLSEGLNVDVPEGTPLAVELDRAVTLRGRGRVAAAEGSTIYTAKDRIRAAQQSLAQKNYYRGAANGVLNDATRRALFQYQVDNRLSATGNLDGRTAQSLGLNLDGAVAGAALSNEAASMLRRDADALISPVRTELGVSSAGRLSPNRTYAQGDLDLWFALSAFADNAAIYEQIVRGGGNGDAVTLAGKALVNAARRVDTALPTARTTGQTQDGWTRVRRQLATLEQ